MAYSVNINIEKCIGCGLCVSDCPASYLVIKYQRTAPRNKANAREL